MPPHVPPTGPTQRFERATQAPTRTPADQGFGQVFDLAVARARRDQAAVPPIPPAVVDEMDAASRLFDALAAQGHELRFEAGGPDGRVRAELRKVDGSVVRTVSLSEAIDIGGGPPPAA